MRIALCDDEERELCRLSELLAQYQLSRKAELSYKVFTNGTDLLWGMRGSEYDLIFLDVIMPGASGLEAAHELRELDKNVRIVFLTSAPEFAVESYAVGAYHYLIKPATPDTLFPLLDKVRSELPMKEEQGLLLKDKGGVVWVSFSVVEYVEVMHKTVFFHLTDGVVREVRAALSDFEKELLSRPEFLKVHRSYVVNLGHIHAVSAKGAVTRIGHLVPVSRFLYHQTKDAYLHYLSRTKEDTPSQNVTAKNPLPASKGRDGRWRILLVDDEAAERTRWSEVLLCHGCTVQTAESGAQAMMMVSKMPFDCLLLDVKLSGEDGFVLCKKLLEQTNAPVIFISSLTDTDDQLRGFSAGGADYITKDTSAPLFWAKVEARILLAQRGRKQLHVGPLVLDLAVRKAVVDGTELVLTPTEFELLWLLCEGVGLVFTPEELYSAIWGGQSWDDGQTIQLHMSRLRRKLEKAYTKHPLIQAVWGQGYRFVAMDENR